MKKIIRKFVQVAVANQRPVRAVVPRPSQLVCVKAVPTLRDELCDALEHQRRGLEEEQARLDKFHDEANIPRRTEDMPLLGEVVGKRVGMLWLDEDEEDPENSVLRWYYGIVTNSRNVRCDSCTAKIKWDVGGSESDEKLKAVTWAGPDNTLGKGSWKLA